MKTRITKLMVAPEGADLYDDRSTHVSIGGEDALRAQLNKIRGVVNEAPGNQGDQP